MEGGKADKSIQERIVGECGLDKVTVDKVRWIMLEEVVVIVDGFGMIIHVENLVWFQTGIEWVILYGTDGCGRELSRENGSLALGFRFVSGR